VKKHILIAISVLVISALTSTPSRSATVSDLAGVWDTWSVAKLKVSGVGSRSAENPSTTTLNQVGTFTLHEVDSTGTYDYTGNWDLIKDGKKMSIALDTPGQTELMLAWENWLIEVGNEYGISVENIEFSVEKLTISQPSIPKKTLIPKKITLKAKGRVSAFVDGEYLTKRFSYSSKVTFLARSSAQTSFALTVAKSGTGNGTVTGFGIDCGDDCSERYAPATPVTLTATAATWAAFSGWTGCDSAVGYTCTLTMNRDRTVTAAFNAGPPPPTRLLSVNKTGSGSGTVTAAGIDCGADCSEGYPEGTLVTLAASGANGSTLSSWTGCDSVNGTDCSVTMTQDRTVIASFAPAPTRYALTVNKTGDGGGTVTGTGVNCGTDCAESYPNGSLVTLTAAPALLSCFDGWNGCDSLIGLDCTIMMNQARTVAASFTSSHCWTRTLTVNKIGSGSGTISSVPSGIDCGADCEESYGPDSAVVLSPDPGYGSCFNGWTGCDALSGHDCTVVMSGNKTVSGSFFAGYCLRRTLTVNKTGSGSGTVTGPGIDCGGDCQGTYAAPYAAVLTPVAATDSTFSGWTGCDTVNGTICTAMMTAANKTVTASFTAVPISRMLSVEVSGVGTVTGPGIDCGSDCTQSYSNSSPVTLTARATGCSVFSSWTGCDDEDGANCIVTMGQDRTVTATFSSAMTTGVNLSLPATDSDGTYTLSWTLQCLASSPWSIQEAPTPDFTHPTVYSYTDTTLPYEYTFSNKPAGTYCYRINNSQPACITVTLPGAAILLIQNATHYEMVDLRLNNEQFLHYPYVIPPGGSGYISYSSGGKVGYDLGVGIYDYNFDISSWYPFSYFTLSGETSVTAGSTTTLRFDNPTLGQLLTRFSGGRDYIGEYYCYTCDPIWGFKKIHFGSNGTWTLYDNNVLQGSGTASLVSWDDYSSVVRFKLCPACDVIEFWWPWQNFYYRNGTADWPNIQYVGQ
jgi:hypothetical protein